MAGIILLLLSCKKPYICPKEGFIYTHTASNISYGPVEDSIPLGNKIVLKASVPRLFTDEVSNTIVNNNCPIIRGPVYLRKLGNFSEPAADKFLIHSEVGNLYKDSTQFTEGQLKGFRTVQWDGTNADSFHVKMVFEPLEKGIYLIALGQQSYKDEDCALYKYFLKVGHNQHLDLLTQFTNGYLAPHDRDYAYCFKVY